MMLLLIGKVHQTVSAFQVFQQRLACCCSDASDFHPQCLRSSGSAPPPSTQTPLTCGY